MSEFGWLGKYSMKKEKPPNWRAYCQQKAAAKQRGIPFRLSVDEWNQVWNESGKLHLRGVGSGKFCMSRVGDCGPYEIGNVYIQPFNDNFVQGIQTPDVKRRRQASKAATDARKKAEREAVAA